MKNYKCPICKDPNNILTYRSNDMTQWATCQACGTVAKAEYFAKPKTATTKHIKRNQSAKADAGKLMLELIPPDAIEALGRVLTYGATKYGPNKWQTIDDAKNRYTGALLRHLTAYQRDPQSRDAESGLLHVEHVLCNAMFLAVLEERGKK